MDTKFMLFVRTKDRVAVRGPESRVNALQKVMTETIWVAGRKETFHGVERGDRCSGSEIDLLDPVVNVEVEIGERRVEKTFSDVAVYAV